MPPKRRCGDNCGGRFSPSVFSSAEGEGEECSPSFHPSICRARSTKVLRGQFCALVSTRRAQVDREIEAKLKIAKFCVYTLWMPQRGDVEITAADRRFSLLCFLLSRGRGMISFPPSFHMSHSLYQSPKRVISWARFDELYLVPF